MTPDEIIQQMKAGNERFRSGKPQHRDLMSEAKATAKGQNPAAIVFSCIDSRAPARVDSRLWYRRYLQRSCGR
jgi:carbonic anhydrase